MTWEAVNAYIEDSKAFGTAAEIVRAGLQLHEQFQSWFREHGEAAWERTVVTFSGEQPAEEMLFFALGHMAYHLVQLYRYLDLIGVLGFPRLPEDELLAMNQPTTMGGGTHLAEA
jgi:hypothetical protein